MSVRCVLICPGSSFVGKFVGSLVSYKSHHLSSVVGLGLHGARMVRFIIKVRVLTPVYARFIVLYPLDRGRLPVRNPGLDRYVLATGTVPVLILV